MRRIALLSSLLLLLTPLMAESSATTVEDRLLALEAEVAALRDQLDPEVLAKAIAEQLLIAQRKAMEPPTPAEAVAKLGEQFGFDEAKMATVTGIIETQRSEMAAIMEQMRGGDIPREEIRTRFGEVRERHQAQLAEHLDEEQIRALQEAQRPPMGRGRGRGGFGGGPDLGDGDRGGRRSRGDEQSDGPKPGQAEF